MKVCSKCHTSQEESEFRIISPKWPVNRKDYLSSYCKACHRQISLQYSQSGKGKLQRKGYERYLEETGYYRYGHGAIVKISGSAKKRGISFDLTEEQLESWWHQTQDICYYCGSTLEKFLSIRNYVLNYSGSNCAISKFKRLFRIRNHKHIGCLTIDRKDNNRGYVIDNIVKSCWFCNCIKGDFFTEKQFLKIAPDIISTLEFEIQKEITPP